MRDVIAVAQTGKDDPRQAIPGQTFELLNLLVYDVTTGNLSITFFLSSQTNKKKLIISQLPDCPLSFLILFCPPGACAVYIYMFKNHLHPCPDNRMWLGRINCKIKKDIDFVHTLTHTKQIKPRNARLERLQMYINKNTCKSNNFKKKKSHPKTTKTKIKTSSIDGTSVLCSAARPFTPVSFPRTLYTVCA